MKTIEQITVDSTQTHNMVTHEDEQFYQKLYHRHITDFLKAHQAPPSGKFLDLGCGQGRMTIPLAQWAQTGHVDGVDISEPALEYATKYAAEEQINNVSFTKESCLDFLRGTPDHSYDAIVCLEVTFYMPSYKEVVAASVDKLKPGGAIIISFRTQYFNLLYHLRQRNWDSLRICKSRNEGRIFNSEILFSWHTPEQASNLLRENGYEPLRSIGIGCFSGLNDDPLAHFARPSNLAVEEQDRLLELEYELGEEYANCSRYVLFFAKKPKVGTP